MLFYHPGTILYCKKAVDPICGADRWISDFKCLFLKIFDSIHNIESGAKAAVLFKCGIAQYQGSTEVVYIYRTTVLHKYHLDARQYRQLAFSSQIAAVGSSCSDYALTGFKNMYKSFAVDRGNAFVGAAPCNRGIGHIVGFDGSCQLE